MKCSVFQLSETDAFHAVFHKDLVENNPKALNYYKDFVQMIK